SGLLPKPIDQSVEPRSKLVKHVSKNLSFLPACPRRHMKGMIGVRKVLAGLPSFLQSGSS
ncbi:MAG: hypothetical protein WBC87_20475, partial [Pseudolabrys sp.]